jgi:asparagine synthase (glutamine-hydrolysing)
VVQVGEGSDEQFAGYYRYLQEIRFFNYYYSLLPAFAKNLIYKSLKASRRDWIVTEYARRSAEYDSPFFGGALAFSEELKSQLLAPQIIHQSTSSGRVSAQYMEQISKIGHESVHGTFLTQMIYAEFKNRLPELLLMRVDKMSMATSIEARVPFLDHRLVEFSFRIPQSLKIKHNTTKYILKKAAEGIIPNEIIYRKKQGFAAPIREWFRHGKLSRYAHDRIYESELMRLGFFQRTFIDSLFTRHASGKENFERELWCLLLLCMWHDRFFTSHAI